jgi:hypothetical protein
VQLPPPQPVDPAAYEAASKPEEPAPAPAIPRTAARRAPPKPETPAPIIAAPAEPVVSPVQEMLPAEERKRYQESANARKAQIRHLLTQIKSHRLSVDQNRDVKRVQSLVAQSDDVEKRGDMRQADALAERGLILARELANGK